MVWFVVSSAACALAPGTAVLIVTRVLQGVGAALLTPGSLAILQASFDPDDRGRAIGSWSGLGGVATAAGPLLGGYLIAAASWRFIFLVNVPVGAVVLLLSVRHVPESRDPNASGRIDVAGAALATLALAGVTFALIEGPHSGWGDSGGRRHAGGRDRLPRFGFVLVERSSPAPMLPFAVFRVRQFTMTNAVTFIVYAALGGALFLLPVQLQVADGYSPLESGVALLPLTVVMLLLSARSGRLATRIGPRLQMSVGPVVVGAGLALLARITTDSSYLSGVLPAVLVFGFGLAITVAPLDRHRPRRRLRRAFRPGLGGQQRRGQDRRAHRRGGAPGARRDLRDQLSPSGPTVGRVPERGADRRRPLCRGRRGGRPRHPEPAPVPDRTGPAARSGRTCTAE